MLSKLHAEDDAPNMLQTKLQTILDSALRVEARLDNAGIVKRNQLERANNSGTTVYVARKKQVAGDGLALATALAPVNVNVPPPQANATVGAVFHATIDTHGMNHANILGLIQFYNEDFGIAAEDTVSTRSQKITNWLTEPMF
ncbi:hypothetical protein B0H13DRAFT_2100278 [Mycena leptocephala]|nr:hypothetical protein B0H13DRAFT_2100278 [Mycena leptocephala]